MKKISNFIKDIIYDKNDLLIALIILALAGFIINDKIGIIMSYPEILAAQIQEETTSSKNDNDIGLQQKGQDTKPEGETQENPTEKEDPEEEPKDNEETGKVNPDSDNEEMVPIHIEYGATGSKIAQILIDSGLLQTKEEFFDAVNESGADTKLQAGNFEIPANATPSEIISIITN